MFLGIFIFSKDLQRQKAYSWISNNDSGKTISNKEEYNKKHYFGIIVIPSGTIIIF